MGEIRFVGTGETRGYPYLVCKKRGVRLYLSFIGGTCGQTNYIMRITIRHYEAYRDTEGWIYP